MVGEVIGGISALKSALDLTRALKDIDDRVKLNEARMELQEKILDAQQAQSALQQKLDELESELRQLKAWDAEKKRYKLTEIKPGILAYTLKDGMENGEPAHSLCTSCYQTNAKSILVSAIWNPGRCQVLICNDCGWYGYLQGAADPAHKDQRPKPYRGP